MCNSSDETQLPWGMPLVNNLPSNAVKLCRTSGPNLIHQKGPKETNVKTSLPQFDNNETVASEAVSTAPKLLVRKSGNLVANNTHIVAVLSLNGFASPS